MDGPNTQPASPAPAAPPVDAPGAPPSSAPSRPCCSGPLPLIAIGLLALLLRGLYLLQINHSPLPQLLMGDALAYDLWAREIAKGDWVGKTIFYQAPLYPYFLGVIYALFGHSLLAVRLVQTLMGAAGCVMLARAGRSFLSPAVGLAAGLLLAVYPSAIFFDALIQKSVLDTFLITGVLCLMGLIRERVEERVVERDVPAGEGGDVGTIPRSAWGWWLAAGAVLGLLMLSRENALVLVAVVFAWAAVGLGRQALARRATWVLALLLGLAVVLMPVAVRNKVVGGEFHLTTSQFGPNFYIGNNPIADGLYRPLRAGNGTAEFERADATALAEHAMKRTLSPKEVSAYWTGEATRFIRAEPAQWLVLMGRKAMLVFNAVEIGDTEDQYTYSDESWLLRGLGMPLHFGTIVPLAVAGLVLTRQSWRRSWPLLGMALAYAASVAIFYVFARYRFPLTPFLLLYAAGVGVEGWRAVRARRWTALGVATLLALAAAVAANWPMGPATSVAWIRASAQNNIGSYLSRQLGRHDEAIAHYEAALRHKPDYDEAHNNLAVALARRGQTQQAAYHYLRAIEINPNVAGVRYNYGLLLANNGKFPEAVREYERALQINPDYAAAHNNLGVAYAAMGRLEDSIAQYKAALMLDPADARAHNGWGTALARLGKIEEALTHFTEAVRIDARLGSARFNQGRALMTLGRVAEAAAAFEQVLRDLPNDANTRQRLAECYRALGRNAEADAVMGIETPAVPATVPAGR
ncbi:MAG: tetratricopeptide repeat protein [Planctomycetota bacterium]|nr:tetratricopeptide repeat protein [Planctomycetota bacterium]